MNKNDKTIDKSIRDAFEASLVLMKCVDPDSPAFGLAFKTIRAYYRYCVDEKKLKELEE